MKYKLTNAEVPRTPRGPQFKSWGSSKNVDKFVFILKHAYGEQCTSKTKNINQTKE